MQFRTYKRKIKLSHPDTSGPYPAPALSILKQTYPVSIYKSAGSD